jgi:hypothetical protein
MSTSTPSAAALAREGFFLGVGYSTAVIAISTVAYLGHSVLAWGWNKYWTRGQNKGSCPMAPTQCNKSTGLSGIPGH